MMWTFERFGQRIALLDEKGQALSYARLAEEGAALMRAVGGRRLVFGLCRNELGSVAGYAGMVNTGAVPLLLPDGIDAQLLSTLYQTYRPAFLWAPEDFAWEGCQEAHRALGYRLLRTPFGDETALHDDLALLLTTSGSTGSPKLVRQSYRNIEANTRSIVQYLRLDENERPITTLPMNYTYCLSILNSHLWVGATILVAHSGIAQRSFWDFFRREGATSFGGVPYTYEMLDRMRFTRMDLPSLRTMTQAGGRLAPELHAHFVDWCERTGRQFIVMYGQCEATARMAYLPWEMSAKKIGSMGVAIPGGRLELVGVDGQPVQEAGVVGELRYYGDNVTLGYAQCAADLALGDERHGVLDTGDMAMRDEDGYYTIVGRKKRFLKLFGNRVNLDEAERLIKAAFPDCDVAVGGRDDHLTLYAVQGGELPAMREYLSQKTGLPVSGFFTQEVAAIPKNEAGKTLYRELEEIHDGR